MTRLLINPWLSLRRITPMIQMAYTVRGLDRKRLLLYYTYGAMTKNRNIIRLLREYCVTPAYGNTLLMSAASHEMSSNRLASMPDRGVWNTFQNLYRMDLEWVTGPTKIDSILGYRNWKTFQDIYPDPFFNPEGVQEFLSNMTVNAVLRSIVEEQRWCDLPILGDALEEAGCYDVATLGHCRANFNHTQYCWLADYLYHFNEYQWLNIPERKGCDNYENVREFIKGLRND